MKRIVEVCAGSYQDCIAAYKGKADRVELNSALSVGGLTPSVSSLRKVKEETNLKVICMVRPRAAGFCYDEDDEMIIMEDAKLLLDNGADGISFGFLNEDGTIKEDKTAQMIELVHSYHKEAVFHRAFDVCPDAYEAIETLIRLGADRILTSGQKAKAFEGKDLLKDLQEKYGDKIELLPGSGVNATNAIELMEYTGINQIHSSCKSYLSDPTTANNGVSYAYLTDEHEMDYDIVNEDLVTKLVEVVKQGA